MDKPRQPVSFPQPGEQPPEPPEMPKFLTRRSALVMAIGFGVLALIAVLRFGGTSATIDAKGVGPLVVGKSTRLQMQTFARGPVSFWLSQRGNPPVHFNGQLWQYKCIGQSTVFGLRCRTLYGITHGHVATIETSSPLFYTAARTRIGTPLSEARKHDNAKWSGWQVKCPHLSFPAPKGTVFLALVAKSAAFPKGFVSGIYLSATPSSFAYCAA
jgi:hypothetical protein